MSSALGPGDWTSAVEQAVTAELRRRQAWTRWARWSVGAAALTGAAALALLAWQLRAVPGQTLATAEAAAARRVAPLQKTDAELYANQVALARHQVDLDDRLARLEAEAAALARTLQDRAGAPLPPERLPASLRRLPAAQARQQARLDMLEQRVRQLERATAPGAPSGP
jgi:hypothetical protein